MVDPNCLPTESRISRWITVRSGHLVIAVAFAGPWSGLHAQAPASSVYPVDPSAAAGMTTGLPNGVTTRQAEMVQVRTSAQGAQGAAAAASMARTADQSIEVRNQEIALQAARERKAIKTSMMDRLKFDGAAESYNKVSASDMSTWKTAGGGVRVERNVPDAFLMSLIEAEEQTAARAEEGEGRKRFSLFGKDAESSSSDSGGGFLSGIRPPRLSLPGFGRGGGDSAGDAGGSPPPSDTSEPSFAQSGSSGGRASAASPAAVGSQKPGVVPMISGAALVDGRSPVGQGQAAATTGRSAAPETVSFSDQMPDTEKKKPGLFSMFQSGGGDASVPASSSGGGGGGLFGFGKKKSASSVGSIDAGLFPEGSVNQEPTGRPLSGGSRVESVAQTSAAQTDTFASASSGIELPGQTVEKSRGFSIPKPHFSMPSIPSLSKPARTSETQVPTLTTVNSSGSSYYVVSSTAQFMVYGATQMQSEVRALPAGTTVLMTKPGEQWASIRLSNGTEGVVQNKHLRPAAAGEVTTGFEALPPASAPAQ